jgi:hypothetical protein
MSEYVRPMLPKHVYYDADGNVIDYGNRWPHRMAPDDRYSVVSNPERFAPLYLVADALIEHLKASYDVTGSEDIAHTGDLMRRSIDAVRAVRLVPSNPDGAPLTFVFTSFPGVVVHAGLLEDFIFPDCGCDACDESIEGVAEEVERVVLTVAAGRFSEVARESVGLGIGYDIFDAEGRRLQGHRSRPEQYSADRTREAEERLRGLPNGWQPWRRRPTADH